METPPPSLPDIFDDLTMADDDSDQSMNGSIIEEPLPEADCELEMIMKLQVLEKSHFFPILITL